MFLFMEIPEYVGKIEAQSRCPFQLLIDYLKKERYQRKPMNGVAQELLRATAPT